MAIGFSASSCGFFGRWFSRERLGLSAIVLFLLVSVWYATSYYHLSRRGMQEAKPNHFPGFFYVPAQEIVDNHDLSRHYFLMRFYASANVVDQALFRGDCPIRGVLWGLSGPGEKAVPERCEEKGPTAP